MHKVLLPLIIVATCSLEVVRESQLDYNLAPKLNEQAVIENVMKKVLEANGGKTPSGHSYFKVFQRLGKDQYLVKRGEMPLIAAVIKRPDDTALADETELDGYLFPLNETLSYISVLGTNKSVELYEYQAPEYAFQNSKNFVRCLQNGMIFYCYGDNIKCKDCNGFGKLPARTQTGHKPCAKCNSVGKLKLRINIFIKKTEE